MDRSHSSSSARGGSDSGYGGQRCSGTTGNAKTSRLRNCFVVLYGILTSLLYLAVLLLGLISLGSFTTKQSEISSSANHSSHRCVLFGTASKLGPNELCTFFTAGQSFVAVIVLIFILSTVIKTIYRKSGLSKLLFLEVLVISLILLLLFSVAVITSLGLNRTCGTNNNCSIINKEGIVVPFKKSIETAAVTAWLGTALLLLILLIHIGLLFIYFIVSLRKKPDEENLLLLRRGPR